MFALVSASKVMNNNFSMNSISCSLLKYEILCHTAKNQCRKFEINISRKGIVRLQSQYPHSSVCVRFIYSHDRSAYSAAGKYVDQSWEYISRSQTHECGNWDWGRAIPRKGIHKWDFRCSALLRAIYEWKLSSDQKQSVVVIDRRNGDETE
jgi:hypothetical protein